MTKRIVARWSDWAGTGLEHLVLNEGSNEIVAEAGILATADDRTFAARYRIVCDGSWRVRKATIALIGSDSLIELSSDGRGNWVDGSATALPQLDGAIDVDLSLTPFTNTLPIRRLSLRTDQTQEILAVYIQLPSLTLTTDRQRYTCLETGKRYRYESVDSDFTRVLEVDDHGLVTTYPGLFRRVA